jgi:hypothetical protein
LISDIVKSEHRRGMGIERIVLVDRFEIGGDQPGLPLMMVEDIRGETHVLTKVENGFGEENKSLGIVEVIALGRAVKVFPVKKLFPTDEINWDVRIQMAQVKIGLELLISKGDFNLFAQVFMGKPRFFHRSVIRHD